MLICVTMDNDKNRQENQNNNNIIENGLIITVSVSIETCLSLIGTNTMLNLVDNGDHGYSPWDKLVVNGEKGRQRLDGNGSGGND